MKEIRPNILILMSNNEIGGITSSALGLSKSFSGQLNAEIAYFGLNRQILKTRESWHQIAIPKFSNNFKILTFIFRLKSLLQFVLKKEPSVIICQDPSSSLVSFVCRMLYPRFEVVGMCHVPNELLTRIDKAIIKYIFPKLRNVVVPSEFISGELKYLRDSLDIVVIPNSISDDATFCPWPRKYKFDSGSYLFVGRLEKEKNPIHIISMATFDSDSKYVICGDGAEMSNLTKRSVQNAHGNVSFLGYQAATELLNLAGVVVVPSLTESFGVIAIESWLHGVPTLVSSNAKGVLEMMKREDLGLILNLEDDLEIWTRKARELSKSRVSDSSILMILNTYHPSAQFEKWVKIIV